MAGVAVVEDDRGRREQHADEEVPHHPAGGREPEDAVAGLRVEVQVHLLEVLEQDAALPVDDRLREAGGARASRAPRAGGRTGAGRTRARRLLGARRGSPRPSPSRRGSRARRRAQPISPAIPATTSRAVEVLAAVAVAVDREQHLRLDLGEAVDHAARAELRAPPRTRPRRSTRRRGKRRRSRGCSAGRRRRGRPRRPRASAARPRCARSRRAARPRSTRPARAARTRGGSRPRESSLPRKMCSA